MANILHRIGIPKTTLEAVYNLIATARGIETWWTTNVVGESKIGNELQFIFGGEDGPIFKIIELEQNKKVLWKCIFGPPEWIETHIEFIIEQQNDEVVLLFRHTDWKEEVDFMHHCSTQWAYFLIELRNHLAKVRTARPYGNKNFESISDWTK